ncbi:MAG: hypothetical protein U0W40_19725 [Acidimicrobiia bacterium]
MPRATERLTALALAALVSLAALLVLGQGTARASDRDLGWLRLTPDQGRIDVAVDATTQSRCPKGEAVVVSVAGPGVPRNDDIGYIVGNTAISALTPQGSGQLTVPLALTFKDWFADNAPGVKPKGTYTLTLVCRDRLRGSKTYGEYVAQVAIAGGKFRALGAAAQPAAQPSAPAPSSPAAQPGAGSGTSATPAASAPAASAPASAAPSAAATSGGPAPGRHVACRGLARRAAGGCRVRRRGRRCAAAPARARRRGDRHGRHRPAARPRRAHRAAHLVRLDGLVLTAPSTPRRRAPEALPSGTP